MANVKLLIFVDWYLPAFKAGGPVRSVFNLTESLKEIFDISIVTGDRDVGETTPLAGVETNAWVACQGNVRVLYVPQSSNSAEFLAECIATVKPNSLYVNSLFSRRFSVDVIRVARRAGFQGRIVIAPRGMLGAGALRIKMAKKYAFLAYARVTRMHKGVVWHATDANEAECIARFFGRKAEIWTVPNLVAGVSVSGDGRKKSEGFAEFLFFSRVTFKKNLHGAIEFLRQVRGRCRLTVIGPEEDEEYCDKCKELASRLPSNVSVRFLGAIAFQRVVDELAFYHFLLLPTFHENFGHAIVESMLAGLPVIISDQTPWRELRHWGVGFDIPLSNPEIFVRAIEEGIQMGDEQYRLMSERAREMGMRAVGGEAAVKQYARLFMGEPRLCEVEESVSQ